MFLLRKMESMEILSQKVDQMAKRHITVIFVNNFPDHQFKGEDVGLKGTKGDWLCMIDPLEGTKKFEIRIPVYNVSITVMHHMNVVLGVIYDSHLDRDYIAKQGEGSYKDTQALKSK
ncbi:inositol monophosphatase family protein [Paenibacillus sp. FSL H3-0457]|uniref:inositol monophosphatase family protein n=1 Tax=Paenibacillus sp. FSL H3-0457 TaxID=2921430 RepID=UPI0030EED7B3